eukprot:TRINITY_DN9779_c0_g1::TRINITY_DN9779_c0_g1_i1::g.4813::m.4813 TRINITY_DN9779_c0_g1::TRINITY_DN9779_c0_g1_i1::g.4813  ORF type:complete len:247 (+),score=8.60,sp/Q9SE33/RAR1_ARATH/44.58/3e-57,sp/Q9SE33/RAR1_ARATH/41.94/2e-11,CHORD/PF04968.7/1.7e-27,CHORD/PF04968.7/1e-26 TRINITY_DN9779_c0_g1_i1:49-789(+)
MSLRCMRIGCDAKYNEDENHENVCTYHPGPPVFHDGMKEWGCCKQKHFDFNDFTKIPGCAVGKHTTEKPTQPKKATPPPSAAPILQTNIPDCSWCRNGLECQVHQKTTDCARCKSGIECQLHKAPLNASNTGSGNTAMPVTGQSPTPSSASTSTPAPSATPTVAQKPSPPQPTVGADAVVTCKRKGCGVKYKESDNHDGACHYHPGPPVFHDRKRGWACCDVFVKDFDEFLEIPPCSVGRHDYMAS